ncbi:MAG: hypothetical protein WCI61_06905 [Chloroflexota bacterium]
MKRIVLLVLTALVVQFVDRPRPATAAEVPPMWVLGRGLGPSQYVEAFSEGKLVGVAFSNAGGDWLLHLYGPGATPAQDVNRVRATGVQVEFAVDGWLLADAITFVPGTTTPLPGLRPVRREPLARYQPIGGRFSSPPVFDAQGFASAVFLGGSLGELESAAARACARGVWLQDAAGDHDLLIVDGPAWWKRVYIARFPLKNPRAVTLVRHSGDCPPAYPEIA